MKSRHNLVQDCVNLFRDLFEEQGILRCRSGPQKRRSHLRMLTPRSKNSEQIYARLYLASRSRRAGWFVSLASLILMTGAMLILLPSQTAQAKPKFLASARARYPQLADSRLNTCGLCHRNGGGSSRNAFGEAFASNGFSLVAIEHLDSDGDGYTNLEEFKALTFPGNPKDFPRSVAVATPAPTTVPDECGN